MPCGFHLRETVDEWAADAPPARLRRAHRRPPRPGLRARRLGLLQPARAAGHRRHRAAGRDLRSRAPSSTSRRSGRGRRSGRRSAGMPFRATFDCLWCGARPRLPRPGRPRGLGAALPGLRRQGRRQRVPALPAAPGADRAGSGGCGRRCATTAGRRADSGRRRPAPRRRRPPGADVDAEMLAYYEARAPEYDDWYLRRGRYERGPVHDAAWNAELDIAGRWLDALPIHGEIVELAAGTGWWSPLLASKGELSLYDGAPAPLDRARERLVAHRLRAHLHVRDAWAEPDRAVDAVFTGFWLSHVPRARLDDVPRARPALAQARRDRSPSSTRCPIPSRARRTIPRPPTTPRSAAWPTAASSRSSRSTTRPTSSRPRFARRASSTPTVTTTGRFFLTGSSRRRRLTRARGPDGPEPDAAAILRAMSPLAKSTIATVGSGVMAEAMIAGMLRGKLVEPGQVVASHPRDRATRAPRPRVRHPDGRLATPRPSRAPTSSCSGSSRRCWPRSAARSARTCAAASWS